MKLLQISSTSILGFWLFAQVLMTSALPETFDISSLNGTNGFVINGAEAGESSGDSVCYGDVNGDGYIDIIIGAPTYGPDNNGIVYVVFGTASGFPPSFSLSALDGGNGFTISGANASSYTGNSVSSGDVNGDGYADIIIGAPFADVSAERYNAGKVYVVFGKASFSSTISLTGLTGSNGLTLLGFYHNDYVGYSVSSGDVNGDGYADIIVGAPDADPNGYTDAGIVYIVFGKSSGWSSSVELNDVSIVSRINGNRYYLRIGEVLTSGDFNGDGFADIIIGDRWASPEGGVETGITYIIFGKSYWYSIWSLFNLNGQFGLKLNGGLYDECGSSVFTGDVNGDGYADVIIG